jgi:hypothetical protein
MRVHRPGLADAGRCQIPGFGVCNHEQAIRLVKQAQQAQEAAKKHHQVPFGLKARQPIHL